ncbi:CLUMA_CG020767, isoform A [Clunio marinus]|uniref:CLUMA_CG020767, isoform A n=1 Tax=Clunio marinus TaxID=568069 RepID=A0A1J1J5Z4_9DIPT|nr:CLUMA_CG020767, isoform A [Clunio marinus]
MWLFSISTPRADIIHEMNIISRVTENIFRTTFQKQDTKSKFFVMITEFERISYTLYERFYLLFGTSDMEMTRKFQKETLSKAPYATVSTFNHILK